MDGKQQRRTIVKIEAVVFDFDGVCIDTEMARFTSWQQIYTSFGLELPMAEWIKNIGKASWVSDPFIYLQRQLGKPLSREELNTRHRVTETAIADTLPLQPGFSARLEEARSLNVPCAIASSSSHNWVDGHLQRRGLFELFSVTVCREDTATHKPEPEPYLSALQRIGINSTHAVAVEDSPPGIASAKAAGLFCIAVPCSITSGMDFSEADLIVSSLEEVSFLEMMNTL